MSYQHMGRVEEAIAEAQEACELSGRKAPTLGTLGLAYGLAGRRGEAQAVLEELTTQRRITYVPPWAIAAVCRGLGEVDQAFEWLERGVEERDVIAVTGLKSDSRYIALHGHPRYPCPAAEDEPGALIGTSLSHYRIVEKLGAGGMGGNWCQAPFFAGDISGDGFTNRRKKVPGTNFAPHA